MGGFESTNSRIVVFRRIKLRLSLVPALVRADDDDDDEDEEARVGAMTVTPHSSRLASIRRTAAVGEYEREKESMYLPRKSCMNRNGNMGPGEVGVVSAASEQRF